MHSKYNNNLRILICSQQGRNEINKQRRKIITGTDTQQREGIKLEGRKEREINTGERTFRMKCAEVLYQTQTFTRE